MLLLQSSKHKIWWGLWIYFLTPYSLVPGDRIWAIHGASIISVSSDLIHLQERIHGVTSTTARIRTMKTPPKNHAIFTGYNDISWSVEKLCVTYLCGWTCDMLYIPHLMSCLTLILLTWRIGWAPNNVCKWQMGFNSAFEGLIFGCQCFLTRPLSFHIRNPTRYEEVRVRISVLRLIYSSRVFVVSLNRHGLQQYSVIDY